MPSDEHPDWQDQRKKIIGLGESSLRKSYYPELREKMLDLEKKNTELQAAYEELTSTEEELRANYDELARREQDLKESETRFKDLFNNMSAGVIIYSPTNEGEDFIIRDINQAVERIEKIRRSEIIGKSILEIFPGVREFGLFSVLRNVAKTGTAELFPVSQYRDNRITGWRENYVYRLPSGEIVAIYDDVTEKKQAEEAQKESERLYRTLVETTGTGFVIIDTEGRVIDANQKYVELSGHETLEEILGQNVIAWTADYEKERNAKAVEQCAKTGTIRNFEVDYTSPDGVITPVEINATVVSYGGTIRILTLCRDISGRRNAEKALRDSEAFYRTIFNTTGSATVIIDEDTTIVRSNNGFARLSGYSVDEIEGKHRWTEFVAKDDLMRMKSYHDARRKDSGSAPEVYEFSFINREGMLRHCICYVSMIPGTQESVASIVDISERVIAEKELMRAKKHLEAIYEGSPDLIFVHEAHGRLLDVNENVLVTYGMTREEVISADPQDMSGRGYTAEMAMGHIREAVEKGRAEFTWVGRRRNGEEFPVEVRLRRIEYVNEQGEPELRILAISRDITERRMAERALEQARKKLGLLNTVIFQDIQTTVFALSAYVQLAAGNRDEEKAKAYTDKESFLISKIVSSLNFTKNYQDLGIHPPKWQSVSQVFLYAISHLDSLKIRKQMAVEGLEIYADPLLENVFFNLIENSFIHGQRVTEISLTYHESDTGITIIMTDNGIGIPAGQKPKVFEQGGGKNGGLGLFLAREILSITGIDIRETGIEGVGARFELLVPKGAYRFKEELGKKP